MSLNDAEDYVRTIDIEEEVYQYLVSNQTDFGQTISDVLRRLLDIEVPQESDDGARAEGRDVPEEISDFIATELRYGNATFKYVTSLAFLHERHADDFDRLLSIKGRNRVYFSRSKEEIEESGTHTRPVRIPGSDYYVVTNSPTRRKKVILERAMRVLGYGESAIRAMKAAIR